MSDKADSTYLSGLAAESAQTLARVNGPGLDALRKHLVSGEAVAFLGAGASAPLYPPWTRLIGALVEASSRRLSTEQAATCRALAAQAPEEVSEILRRHLGPQEFREAMRDAFSVRRDPESGRTWTEVHELVCRCLFKAVVTTNYDPGIVDARNRVRREAVGTGFMSWTDEDALDRWRTGDIFGDDELPVLFAHGRHTQPSEMILATTEYRRAYSGKLSRVLSAMIDTGHLVWIGFSFADQRIAAILREVAQASGTQAEPGTASRHVAVIPWDPHAADNDPTVLAQRAEIGFGAHAVFYPAPHGDHSALQTLLRDFTDPRFPPVRALPESSPLDPVDLSADVPAGPNVPAAWNPPAEMTSHFTGRAEELARLARWAADPTVRLVGITAWGGAGKTALVTEWLQRHAGAVDRDGIRGVFAWNFYADASAEEWAQALLGWASRELDVPKVKTGRLGNAVLSLLQSVPLLLVLDGLEVAQESLDGGEFGRLLNGTLREVLTGACQLEHAGLVILTSRFPFADLESFDGLAARMLDVPPLTPAEGAELLTAAGGGWLPAEELRELVADVDGHALAVAALGAILADRPPTTDLTGLRAELTSAAGTNARVAKVLTYYGSRLAEADRYLVAAVSLFTRPVTPAAVLTVAKHEALGGRLDGWNDFWVESAARDRLAGLLSLHPNGTLTAHPLVRDSFRPLALGAAEVAADTTLTGLPAGTITSHEDALRVVEAVELLIAAGQWDAATDLYRDRTDSGDVWMDLPAARLGQRAASAFVATDARREACEQHLGRQDLKSYLTEVGLCAANCGDLATAQNSLTDAIKLDRNNPIGLVVGWGNLAECLTNLGDIEGALHATDVMAAAAVRVYGPRQIRAAAAYRGRALALAGVTAAAEDQFLTADRRHYNEIRDDGHLYSLWGVWWAEFLARTGRIRPARTLTELNRALCEEHGWSIDLARCDRLLGSLNLTAGNLLTAQDRLASATAVFKEGDYLVDLAETLPLLADCARTASDLDSADRYVAEALALAVPRGLVPAQTAALTVRARVHADRGASGSTMHLGKSRDTAEAAYRLAARHRLAWHQLDIIETHDRLDRISGTPDDWATRGATLRARLIPANLDRNPLLTVERETPGRSPKHGPIKRILKILGR